MYTIFKQLLEQKGMTANAFSKATGIAQSTLSDWKNGKSTPKFDKLQIIAKYFDVDVSVFTKHSPDYIVQPLNLIIESSEPNIPEQTRRIMAYTKELSEIYDLLSDASPEVQRMVLAMLRETKKKYDQE